MVNFRNNNIKRNNFRRNGRSDRGFKSNGERKFSSNFSNNDNFQRKIPGRNNHNAPKLIEKYNNLAREALSSGDKILSENYFQHADHFTRILAEQENYKKLKNSSITPNIGEVKDDDKKVGDPLKNNENSTNNNDKSDNIKTENG